MEREQVNEIFLGFFFKSELVSMSALSLTAVGSLELQNAIAFPTDLFGAVKLFGDGGNSGIHQASSQSEYKVECGLLLDVVVG